MRQLTELYQINGAPLYAPDEDAAASFSDLDASDSGRDESGVMQRVVVRRDVGSWELCYASLTDAEVRYTMALLKSGASFAFTAPGPDGEPKSCMAYCSKHSMAWHNARLGVWKNVKFTVIEC